MALHLCHPASAQPGALRRARPRRTVLARAEAERFVWKGGGSGRGAAWEAAALEGRGGYASDGRDVSWFYLDEGSESARPLLLLHGMPAYSYLWRGVVAPLVAANRRVVAVDLPGFGNSSCAAESSSFRYSLEDYVRSLESVLFETLKLPRGGAVDIVGQGILGGTLAGLLLARCPKDVGRVALLNAALTAETATAMPPPLGFLLNPFMAQLQCQNPLALVGTPIQSASPYNIDAEDTASYIAPAMANSGIGFAAITIAKALKRDGATAHAEALRALDARGDGVLIAWGTDDRWLGSEPPKGVLPKARRVLLDGCGHFAAEDWPQKVVEALLTL